ncbi:DUF5372 family protein [Mesorhizobium sp. M0203]|uniref:DUF5372 family protein n=1 Tax=Mesorhizobium sp. M0203 TaxID=2956912 RepID=UPI0033354D5D
MTTSHGNAASSSADQQLVRVTHPFHPLFARQLPCVGRRYNRHGARLLLQADDTAVWSVPPQWTDLVSPDAEEFRWPKVHDGMMRLTAAQLSALLEGPQEYPCW